jgi:two-component system, NtrC family, nitrogen regulation response regulator NtrX
MTELRVFGPPVVSDGRPYSARGKCGSVEDGAGVVAELLIGESPEMRRLRAGILRVAPTSLPVLVQGETGTGKELVAQALHAASGRAGPFVGFNVCAIGDTMFEDALFGHTRGAFTGATSDAPGYLLEANGGTAFLDEIGGLELRMQAKLLRAIETKSFRPVGGRSDRRSDFRVIAATNEDLERLVSAGRFRADLRHRLDAVVLHLPPLRHRRNDVPALVHHITERVAVGPPPEFTREAMQALVEPSWPGNVRQLRHVVELLVATSDGEVTASDVGAVLGRGAPETGAVESIALRRLLEVMEEVDWSVAAAARQLGVHPATVYRRLQRAGVRVEEKRSSGKKGDDDSLYSSRRDRRSASAGYDHEGTRPAPG